MNIKKIIDKIFSYNQISPYVFKIKPFSNIDLTSKENFKHLNIFPNIKINLEIIKEQYSVSLNGDISIREFFIKIKTKKISAFLLYIDGIIDQNSINNFILKPLLLKNSIIMNPLNKTNINSSERVKTKSFNLQEFIINSLIPENNVVPVNSYFDVISKVNSGFCALFIDGLDSAICIEAKNIKGRNVTEPQHESIIRGSQEGFVENYRTNTSMLRKIINNENLIIEETKIRFYYKYSC